MPDLKKNSLNLLEWYKSVGIDICIQNSPRVRFKINSEDKKNIFSNKINNLKDLEKKIYK
ncbi:MAG: hypothetical protein CFH24_00683, partial [Alphaproteobacteria bacterium MarineAlpha6_Bin2]